MKTQKYTSFFSRIITVLLVVIICALPNVLFSQYKLISNSSKIKLKGTSTKHDWSASVGKMSGHLDVKIANRKINKITGLKVAATAKSIKSGKSSLDKDLHRSLKADNYPKIHFAFKQYWVDKSGATLSGNLTAAGVTKPIKVKIKSEIVGNTIKLSGSFKVKMSDFNIEPPEAYFGTMKTGNTVTISLNLVFAK